MNLASYVATPRATACQNSGQKETRENISNSGRPRAKSNTSRGLPNNQGIISSPKRASLLHILHNIIRDHIFFKQKGDIHETSRSLCTWRDIHNSTPPSVLCSVVTSGIRRHDNNPSAFRYVTRNIIDIREDEIVPDFSRIKFRLE